MRGKICKVCDYKFLMRERVGKAYTMIGASKEAIVVSLRNI